MQSHQNRSSESGLARMSNFDPDMPPHERTAKTEVPVRAKVVNGAMTTSLLCKVLYLPGWAG